MSTSGKLLLIVAACGAGLVLWGLAQLDRQEPIAEAFMILAVSGASPSGGEIDGGARPN